MNIDIDRLRSDLIDYFGSAAQIYGAAYLDVSRVMRASDEEVVNIAIQNGFNIYDYEIKEYIL